MTTRGPKAEPTSPEPSASETAAAPAGREAADLSIGDLSRESGVPVETIRIWERRYGHPASERLPSGHRRYRASQIPWLRAVAQAVALGMRASAAVRAAPKTLLRVSAPTAPRRTGEVARHVELATSLRATELRRRLRRESRAMGATEFLETRVAPLLAELGRAWADGRIAVRHEHLASEVVADLLRELRARHKVRRDAPRIVLATLPGDRHDLGARMAAVVIAAAGFQPVLLGADTPIAEIVASAAETGACAVAVSISLPRGGPEADLMLRRLRESLGAETRVLAGGAGARGPRRAPKNVDLVATLHDLEELLAGLRPPARRRAAAR